MAIQARPEARALRFMRAKRLGASQLRRRHEPHVLRRILIKDQCPSQFKAHQSFIWDGTRFKVRLGKLSLLHKFLRELFGVGMGLDECSKSCRQRHLCSKKVRS